MRGSASLPMNLGHCPIRGNVLIPWAVAQPTRAPGTQRDLLVLGVRDGSYPSASMSSRDSLGLYPNRTSQPQSDDGSSKQPETFGSGGVACRVDCYCVWVGAFFSVPVARFPFGP